VILIRRIFIFIVLGFIPTISFADPPALSHELHQTEARYDHSDPVPRDPGIQVKDGLISIDVKDAEIADVLHEIARKLNIHLMIGDGVTGKTSIKMKGATIEEALRQLCENRAIVFEFVPETQTYRIISVGAYTTKKGKDKKTGSGIAASSPKSKHRVIASAQGTGKVRGRNGSFEYSKNENTHPRKQVSEKMYDSKGRPLYKSGELLIRFKKGITQKQINELHKSLGSTVLDTMPRFRLQKIKLRKGLSEQEAIDLYSASPLVEIVERHALRYTNSITPNDPYFSTQWGLTKIHAPEAWDITQGGPEIVIAVIDTGVDYSHPDLSQNIWINTGESLGDANNDGCPGICGVDDDGDAAWTAEIEDGEDNDGDGLVDENGIDFRDEDVMLADPDHDGYTLVGPDGIFETDDDDDSNDRALAAKDDDENGYADDILGWDFAGTKETPAGQAEQDDEDNDPMDGNGHGTHVAGIIAAAGNNGLGVAGVCWNAKVMVLKVQADESNEIEEWDVIEAIGYAIFNGARIVNCSFGGENEDSLEELAFGWLQQAGILAVCSAGNDGINTDTGPKTYPACYDLDNIISVAASDSDDCLASFGSAGASNYGDTTVDVMAPGHDIKSTVPATHTEAVVRAGTDPYTEYSANGMLFAGTTDEEGITQLAYNCGQGYTDQFPDGVSGNIAVIQRGNRDGTDFYFSEKVANAQDKGAVAAIIYNNRLDGSDDNFDEVGGSLGSPGDWIPVVSISKADGKALTPLLPLTVTVINKQIDPPSAYDTMQGTSMAAPYVSGIAGLLLSVNPALTYTQVKSAILDTVDKIPDVSGKLVSGGRVNARAALSRAFMHGDVSGDNKIGLDDAILALQVVSRMNPQPPACISCGIDVNGDGRIGIEEAIYVLQVVGKMR